MAWTSPMTFTANTALTAAQLNIHLRDNLNETMTAKATVDGSMFFGTDLNELVERRAEGDRIGHGESSPSTGSWLDLATVGPEVTIETGTNAMIMWSAHAGNTSANSYTGMSYAISGATTSGASSTRAMVVDGIAASASSNYIGACGMDLRTDLIPGTNTFTAKYYAGSGTGLWAHRFLFVWPL